MAQGVVHYKFKSAKDFDSISFDGVFISVADLKRAIVDKKGLARDQACELLLTNAQNNTGVCSAASPPPNHNPLSPFSPSFLPEKNPHPKPSQRCSGPRVIRARTFRVRVFSRQKYFVANFLLQSTPTTRCSCGRTRRLSCGGCPRSVRMPWAPRLGTLPSRYPISHLWKTPNQSWIYPI